MNDTMDKGYEKLEIYQLSYALAVRLHKMTVDLPQFEMFEERSQARRSAKRVPASIVEGYCLRRHTNEYLQYLHRAFASCEETRFHLNMLFDSGSLRDKILFEELSSGCDRLGKMLFRFIESVSSSHLSPTYVKESDIPYEP